MKEEKSENLDKQMNNKVTVSGPVNVEISSS